jgi:hypothetical protein
VEGRMPSQDDDEDSICLYRKSAADDSLKEGSVGRLF